jgi:hypothetical protein
MATSPASRREGSGRLFAVVEYFSEMMAITRRRGLLSYMGFTPEISI